MTDTLYVFEEQKQMASLAGQRNCEIRHVRFQTETSKFRVTGLLQDCIKTYTRFDICTADCLYIYTFTRPSVHLSTCLLIYSHLCNREPD